MKPISLESKKSIFVNSHPLLLPVHGATSRWTLSWYERLKVLFTGNIWVTVKTGPLRLQAQADEPLLVDWNDYDRHAPRIYTPEGYCVGGN